MIEEKVQTSEGEGSLTAISSDETSTDGTEKQEQASKVNEVDYKEKFSASTRENQRIRDEHQKLQETLDQERVNSKELETSVKEYEKQLADENPEALDMLILKKKVEKLSQDTALQRENAMMNDYLKSNPDADEQKEALKALGRTFPDRTYGDLYDVYFAPLVKKGEEAYQSKLSKKKDFQAETGKGNISNSFSDEIDLKDFSKLSLAKRKAILKRKNIGEIQL